MHQAALLPDWFLPGTPIAADQGSPNNTRTIFDTGDLNNDGYPDIVVAHGFRKAGVFLNNRDQSFASEALLSEPWWKVSQNVGATSVALGDLDGDRNLDLVIPIYGPHYQGRQIQLYRGLGNGSFVPWPVGGGIITASGAANPMFAGIADFNLDGSADVVVSGNNGAWSVDILKQNANQSFSVADSDRAGQNPQFFDIADFNEDGAPDLVVGALYNGVFVFINEADGTGRITKLGSTYLSAYKHYVVAADFNGDGHADIAARDLKAPRIDLLLGDGTGVFSAPTPVQTSGVEGYLAAADFDRDGDQDLVLSSTSNKSVELLLNNGKGSFSVPISTPLDAAPWGIAVDDFNQDGWADVVVSRNDNTIQILWNSARITVNPSAFTLPENPPANSLVGTVMASGGAGPLTFTIIAGNSDP
ncbi:MAG: FG-GAP repeat domain-containing protein, partial [Cyanobium sp.]